MESFKGYEMREVEAERRLGEIFGVNSIGRMMTTLTEVTLILTIKKKDLSNQMCSLGFGLH